jgi:hypothetical protein
MDHRWKTKEKKRIEKPPGIKVSDDFNHRNKSTHEEIAIEQQQTSICEIRWSMKW